MFYVGQKIVAIRDHSIGMYKKGDEFIVLNIIKAACCGVVCLDIGIKNPKRSMYCRQCDNDFFSGENCAFDCKSFAPLESYRESYSIAIQLVQEMEQVDKQKVFNPKKETIKN